MYLITNTELKQYRQLLLDLKAKAAKGKTTREQNQARILGNQIKKLNNLQQQPAPKGAKYLQTNTK